MTLREYIIAIHSTKLFIGSRAKLVNDIFKRAGSIRGNISVETVNAWLKKEDQKGYRNCGISRYFSKGTIHETEFISFFRNQTSASPTSWKKIQDAFRPEGEFRPKVEDCIIDLTTDNPTVFYQSLLEQFLKIFNLLSSKESDNESEKAPQNETPSKQLRDLFINKIEYYGIMEIINRKPAHMYRNDSIRVNVFVSEMNRIVGHYIDTCMKTSLYDNVKTFFDEMRLQALAIEANLKMFDYDNHSAFVNMESEDDSTGSEPDIKLIHYSIGCLDIADDDDNYDCDCGEEDCPICEGCSGVCDECKNHCDDDNEGIDPVALAELAYKDWGSFRGTMNYLYEAIHDDKFLDS